MASMKVYVVESYFWAEGTIDKIFLDVNSAKKYTDFMNKTCEKEYRYHMSEKEVSNGFNANDYTLYREVSRDCSDWEERSEIIEISKVLSIKDKLPQSEIFGEGELFLYYKVSSADNYSEKEEKEIIDKYLRLELEIKRLKSSGKSHPEIRDILFP